MGVKLQRYAFAFTALGQIIKNNKLHVPVYQRPYSWNAERAREFWEDIASSIEQKQQEYFVGTVVLSEDAKDGRKQIIDGQQRLATITIMLSAMRDFLAAENHNDAAKAIQTDYIASFDLKRRELEPRLVLSNDDNLFFEGLIVRSDVAARPAKQRESNSFISEARTFFDRQLVAMKIAHPRRWYDNLAELLDFVESKLKVVLVTVPNEADAFTIFETLNDRGADLTVSDLLKNYLFGQAGVTNIDAVRDNWVSAVGTLESIGQRGILVDFIRHLWSSQHGATREKDLYANIKKKIDSPKKALDFSHDLYQGAQIYAALYSSDHEYWKSKGSITRQNIQTLIRLDLEQLRPLLIAILSKFPDSAINEVIRKIVSWSIRGLVVGGIGGGKTEKAYTDAAQKIFAGQIADVATLRETLGTVIRTDVEFEEALSRAEITNTKLARYLLLALERRANSEKQPELIANDAVEDVNLEHVLPRRARQGEWDQFSVGQKRTYTHRLGNLTLLRADTNIAIGNKPWAVKRPMLATSKLKLTSEVAANEDWTARAIDDRQKALAALAVQTWPI